MIRIQVQVDPTLADKARRAKRWGRVGAALAALALPTTLFAAVTVPHVFVTGTASSASAVNENFQALADGVNDNDERLTALEGMALLPSAAGAFGYATTSDALGTLSGGFNSSGGSVRVAVSGVSYQVTFAGLSCPTGDGAAFVVPYVTSTASTCRVEGQSDNTSGDCQLMVRCFDSNGSTRDGAISVLYVQ